MSLAAISLSPLGFFQLAPIFHFHHCEKSLKSVIGFLVFVKINEPAFRIESWGFSVPGGNCIFKCVSNDGKANHQFVNVNEPIQHKVSSIFSTSASNVLMNPFAAPLKNGNYFLFFLQH